MITLYKKKIRNQITSIERELEKKVNPTLALASHSSGNRKCSSHTESAFVFVLIQTHLSRKKMGPHCVNATGALLGSQKKTMAKKKNIWETDQEILLFLIMPTYCRKHLPELIQIFCPNSNISCRNLQDASLKNRGSKKRAHHNSVEDINTAIIH